MARPYLNASVEELERLCSASLNDQARLRSILAELNHRSTTRALGLAGLIRKRLGQAAAESDLDAPGFPIQKTTGGHKAGEESDLSDARQVVFGLRGTKGETPPPGGDAAETEPATNLDRSSSASGPPAATQEERVHVAVSSLSPTQRGVTQLIDYVRTLIELGAKPVWSLASYNNLVLHEDDLRDRFGIRHDLSDSDGAVYLKIDRLRRIDPPEPPPLAADWLAVGRDPFKAPAVETLRTAVMPDEEVERLIASGAVDRADVSPTLKPAPGKALRDVVLRLERFPESKAAVEAFVALSWAEWAESERPRRETIDIYERLFSLQQALKLEGSDRPLEVVWGMGVARWSLTPNELDHPIVEQLVELELDDAGAITVRPRGAEAYLRHDVACGDSAVFQGKERDIMFLSMVECPATRTSKTTLTFQQRFNVALSRARDREYLFRSVTEDMLKPDDLKAKVLRHFKNPMEGRAKPAGDLMALCQSGFERDVLARLLDLGYRVQPQVKVGPFSLDLVVEGRDDRRLAVELDGDQYHGPERWADDLGRQRTMERVGWRFWRCWGSSFRIDPESCMYDLVRTLTALGIEPIGSEDSSVVWTEFRTVSGGEDVRATAPEAAAVRAQFPAASEGVQIGDRVQVQVSGDTRVRLVRLTANRHDPDLGVISAQHPSGAALLGANEDDEIEFEIDGKTHRWMLVQIDRELTTA